MTTPPVGGSASGPGEAGWTRLSDGLIGGIHHTLNNRMAALSAVAQILEADTDVDHPLTGAMANELRRLEQTVSLLSLLVGGDRAEPLQLEAVVAGVERLFDMHHSLRELKLEVELSSDLYPLWISPSALRRALLLMVASAGRRARRGEKSVLLQASGDERVVEVKVSGRGPAPDPETADPGLETATPAGAATLLLPWGGDLRVEEDEDGLVLTAEILTLPEARKRERGES
jgi:hypothetical protein